MAKKAAPKAAAKAAAPKAAAAKAKPMTKSELYTTLADKTGLAKKDVTSVLDSLSELITTTIASKKGPGQFVLPGLLKIRVARKPATKAKMGRNPQTGEPMEIKAKPARNVVKVTPLKVLKEAVQ